MPYAKKDVKSNEKKEVKKNEKKKGNRPMKRGKNSSSSAPPPPLSESDASSIASDDSEVEMIPTSNKKIRQMTPTEESMFRFFQQATQTMTEQIIHAIKGMNDPANNPRATPPSAAKIMNQPSPNAASTKAQVHIINIVQVSTFISHILLTGQTVLAC